MNISPAADAPYLLNFCASVVQGALPTVVPCRPVPDGAHDDCFPIVNEHVRLNGGQSVFGWAVWERSGVFIEAEFHAVWQAPDGELVDIVPRLRPFTQIVFLPDHTRKYEGRQVDNFRMALVPDNDVKRFLFLFKRKFEILNAGERAYQHEVLLPKAAMREFQSLHKELVKLESRISKKYQRFF